jgi:hypothetical protein
VELHQRRCLATPELHLLPCGLWRQRRTLKLLKNAVFRDVTPCISSCEQMFRRNYCLHLQGIKICEPGTSVSRWLQADSSLADFYTLKMEAICSSETSVHTKFTRSHIPEDGILRSHRRENLKSYTQTFVCFGFISAFLKVEWSYYLKPICIFCLGL